MICGLVGGFEQHLEAVRQIIGRVPGLKDYAALSLLISPKGALFLTDTYVNKEPNAEEIADIAILAAGGVSRFGIEQKVALERFRVFLNRQRFPDQFCCASLMLAGWRLASYDRTDIE